MTDPLVLLVIAATFLVAGLVKGVVGLGLPTVALAALTASIGLQPAMALTLAPAFITNVWQALGGGHGRAIVGRIWPFLVMATATVWVGSAALVRIDMRLLSAFLGLLLVVYATMSLAGLRLFLSPGRERWAAPLLGAVNGLISGMTGSFAVPGVLYLQACGLPRDQLVQAMGMLFTVSAAALAASMGGRSLLSAELGLLSVAALVPAMLGMAFGQRLRKRLPETLFRRLFLASLGLLGLYIATRSILALAV